MNSRAPRRKLPAHLDALNLEIIVSPSGSLQLIAANGSGRLKVGPLDKEAALMLAKQLVDYGVEGGHAGDVEVAAFLDEMDSADRGASGDERRG